MKRRPRGMADGLEDLVSSGSAPLRKEVESLWCCEPEPQSDPDASMHPKLLLPASDVRPGKHARQIIFAFWRPPPAGLRKEAGVEVIVPCCSGLDVHKKSVVACIRRVKPGGEVQKVVRTFGTVTKELLALSDWLAREGVTSVAMESTGVFWKPVFNLLEGRFQLILANARHIANVPGRKTDVKDCEWIAQLCQYGLLSPSFVPERPQRELRDLTRQRVELVQDQSRVANRIHKVLEDANVKLGSVATDILGASGRDMIEALIAGETDPEKLANLARRKLREKIPQLKLALEGHIRDHHRFMLKLLMDQYKALEKAIEEVSERIEEVTHPQEEAVQRVITHPGIERRSAENILAEIGTDMNRFRTDAHIASWAGLCPGNNESAGKHKSGRTRQGNIWLRRTLVQCAWAASHSKGTYLAAQYRRLAAKRGGKRAVVALAHTILVNLYHMLQKGVDYKDLGGDYFDRQNPERLTRYFVKRLERLGHSVTLSAKVPA
jgi:transposase